MSLEKKQTSLMSFVVYRPFENMDIVYCVLVLYVSRENQKTCFLVLYMFNAFLFCACGWETRRYV